MAEIFEKVLVEVMKAVGKGAAKIIVWMHLIWNGSERMVGVL